MEHGVNMSNFKAILDLFGMSAADAASYLDVSEPEVLRWCSAEDCPPISVWQKLVELFDSIRFAAEDAAKAADLDHLTATDLNSLTFGPAAAANDRGTPLDRLAGPQRMIAAMATASLARVFV